MEVAVSRHSSLYYEMTFLNYWNRAKEKPMDSWYLFSYGAKIDF